MFQCHPNTVANLVKRGELTPFYIGDSVRFDRDEVLKATRRTKQRSIPGLAFSGKVTIFSGGRFSVEPIQQSKGESNPFGDEGCWLTPPERVDYKRRGCAYMVMVGKCMLTGLIPLSVGGFYQGDILTRGGVRGKKTLLFHFPEGPEQDGAVYVFESLLTKRDLSRWAREMLNG
jgi:hypothetical protein